MDLFTRKSIAVPKPSRIVPNILSATGLSRTSLRALFSEIGLFGRQSLLTAHEQAGVYAELRLPAGSVPPVVTSWAAPNPWRIAALRSFTRSALVHDGEVPATIRALAMSFGIQDRVLGETLRVVRNVTLVYGVEPSLRKDVSLSRMDSGMCETESLSACA